MSESRHEAVILKQQSRNPPHAFRGYFFIASAAFLWAVSAALGRAVSPQTLFARLAARFHESIGLWSRGSGFAEIRALWLKSAAGLGGPIRVVGARGTREGTFVGLDADGRLVMRTAEAVETIEAADLFLAPSANGAGPAAARAGAPDESLDP